MLILPRSHGHTCLLSPRLTIVTLPQFLENELQGKLHRARPTRLIQRTQSAQATGQRSCGLAKRAGGRKAGGVLVEGTVVRCVDSAEIRMVEDVEELSADLQPHDFSKMKVLGQREIEVLEAGVGKHVAAHVSELPKRGGHHHRVSLSVATEQI